MAPRNPRATALNRFGQLQEERYITNAEPVDITYEPAGELHADPYEDSGSYKFDDYDELFDDLDLFRDESGRDVDFVDY